MRHASFHRRLPFISCFGMAGITHLLAICRNCSPYMHSPMVGPEGVEPSTFWLKASYSAGLSYRPILYLNEYVMPSKHLLHGGPIKILT